MAKGFSPTKDGVADLMQQWGKTREDLRNAVNMLDSPLIKNTIGRVPGLSDAVNRGVTELMNDGAMSPQQPTRPIAPVANDSTGSLADRLARLK